MGNPWSVLTKNAPWESLLANICSSSTIKTLERECCSNEFFVNFEQVLIHCASLAEKRKTPHRPLSCHSCAFVINVKLICQCSFTLIANFVYITYIYIYCAVPWQHFIYSYFSKTFLSDSNYVVWQIHN